MRFLKMFDRSGMTSKLSDFHAQFRMVGNTYNQTLKELKCHFSEHRAMALVCKLEKYMMQLVQIHYCPRKSVNILAKLHILSGLTIV